MPAPKDLQKEISSLATQLAKLSPSQALTYIITTERACGDLPEHTLSAFELLTAYLPPITMNESFISALIKRDHEAMLTLAELQVKYSALQQGSGSPYESESLPEASDHPSGKPN